MKPGTEPSSSGETASFIRGNRRKGHQRLQPRQRRTRTPVGTVPERHMLLVAPGRVELLRTVAVDRGIPVGAGRAGKNRITLGDRHTAEDEIPHRVPQRGMRDGRLEPQHLLDHIRPAQTPVQCGGQLVRIGEQQENRLIDEVDRGLVTGIDRQIERPDEFLDTEILRGIIGVGNQRAGHIVGRVLAPIPDQALQEPDHLLVVGNSSLLAQRDIENTVHA